MSNLIRPKENSAVTAAAKLALPLFLHWQKLQVTPTANCINSIRKLHGQHAVLLLNHSDRYDPVVAFALSKLTGQDFYYLAARELFDDKIAGWFLQNCGAYSVIRGTPEDAESKELTISLMADGRRKLIEFPEGDVTGNDEHISKLKKDGLHNMLAAQRRLIRQNRKDAIYLLPMAILYEPQADAIDALKVRMSELEAAVGIKTIGTDTIESRAKQLLAVTIQRLVDQNSIEHISPGSLATDLRQISTILVLRIAAASGIELDLSRTESEMLYDLRSKLRKTSQPHAADLDRIQQLLITASTVDQSFTNAVAWRLVDRLEHLLTGRFTIKGSRVAWIESSNAINLRDVIDEFAGSESAALNYLEDSISNAMLSSLQSLKRNHSARLAPLSDRVV